MLYIPATVDVASPFESTHHGCPVESVADTAHELVFAPQVMVFPAVPAALSAKIPDMSVAGPFVPAIDEIPNGTVAVDPAQEVPVATAVIAPP